ncbi:hypothetical protein BC835DRAFT_644766 [Cytidiella melzeri]|nr:hypothetical protein BC835DRAFT_644766 [Cytidiella melzeri]
MASPRNFDSQDEPPPPAYEFCEQEFDRKISDALEASRDAVDDEGEWQVWDEAAFAAAVANMTVADSAGGASSSRSPPPAPALASSTSPRHTSLSSEQGASTPATQPLRVVKRQRQPSTRKQKERPNWYAEAGLGDGPPSAPAETTRPSLASQIVPSTTSSNSLLRQPSVVERESTPPPMFEPIGPSLDGPPYDGYGDPPPPPRRQGLVMTYVPGDSRPASPLHSPTSPSLSHAPASAPTLLQPLADRRHLPRPSMHESLSPSVTPQPYSHHHSAPPPPRPPVQRPSPRPTSAYRDNLKSSSYASTRLVFDPRVAYGGSERSSYYDMREDLPPGDIDPASFYTASVSSIYSASTTAKRMSLSPPAPSSIYTQPSRPQPAYSQPASQHQAQPQHLGLSYPDRQAMRSPAPSVRTVASQPSENYQQSYGARTGYQTQSQSPPSRWSTYQPTTYQPTAYQQQPQQQSAYQPTSYQPPSADSYQPTGYSPTAY